MKRKTPIYGIMLAILACVNCSEAENPEMACAVNSISGPEDDVIGKWKLVKEHTVFSREGPMITDHTCNNIVYHFQMGNILTISSDIEDYSGIPLGQHDYELKQQPLFKHLDHDHTLQIESAKYACSISKSTMILDSSPVDGPILHFIRIQ